MALYIEGATQYERLALATPARIGTVDPYTILAVLRRAQSGIAANLYPVATATGDSPQTGIGFTATTDTLRIPGATYAAGITVTTADGWVCLAWTKAGGSGAVTPRGHKYRYSDGVAQHENAIGTIPATAAVLDTIFLGRFGLAGTANADKAHVAAVALYNRVLSDAEVELASQSVAGMLGTGPNVLALLDGDVASRAIVDLAGNATQQATGAHGTISTQSAPLTYAPDVIADDVQPGAVTPPPATATSTTAVLLPTPSATATGRAPATGTATPALPSPTVSGAARAVSRASGTATLPAPTATATASAYTPVPGSANAAAAVALPSPTATATALAVPVPTSGATVTAQLPGPAVLAEARVAAQATVAAVLAEPRVRATLTTLAPGEQFADFTYTAALAERWVARDPQLGPARAATLARRWSAGSVRLGRTP